MTGKGGRRTKLYRIEFTRRAARQLEELPDRVRKRIAVRIDALAREPRPPSARKLTGSDGFYRLRVGDYRVIYLVEDRVVLVTVVRIAHRRNVYRSG